MTTLRATNSNLAFFSVRQKALVAEFLKATRALRPFSRILLISADQRSGARRNFRHWNKACAFDNRTFEEMGLLASPISFREVARRITEWIASVVDASEPVILAVDMSWGLETNSAAANFENWISLAQDLSASGKIAVASLYNRRLLIEEHLVVALRGHPSVLTLGGVERNPHWLPADLLMRGTLRQQVDFWLSAISDHLAAAASPVSHAAEGTDPMWLIRRAAEEPTMREIYRRRDRWKIRCLGRLRIYRADGRQINWDVPGGATRKTKTLFAFLLQKGGQGAEMDELSDLLWPNAQTAGAARNRLYHVVRCLREALGQSTDQLDSPTYLLRDGSRYVLVPPDRSWLDISTFEQLCRQSQTHIKTAANDEALICLQAADRLYTGDLFEDIPAEYADNSERDWCWSKRYWLRDMFFKVQRDIARIYRDRQEFSSALAHCQKALAIDPLCEIAHEEAMHVFLAQGRQDAIDRQYRLYVDSLTHFDERPQSALLRDTYRRLTSAADIS